MGEPTASQPKPRDRALDALRGLAIFGMVLANMQGSEKDAFAFIRHAEWDGLTVADLVFPLFLLAVGLALPLTFDGRDPRASIAKIVRRSALLWLIGFGIGLLAHPSLNLIDIRFTGVLERIGIVYLICALICRATKTWRVPLGVAFGLMAVHGVLLYTPPPGGFASMAQGEGMSAWLDRAILGGTRMYGTTFDPEGVLSTLSSVATTLLGIAAQRILMRSKKPDAALIAIALILGALAIGALALWPLNKALWTPSFALANAAFGLALLAMLKLTWTWIGDSAPMRLTERLGQLALTLYVVHDLLTLALFVPIAGVKPWALGFTALAATGMPLALASMLFAMIGGGLSMAITLALAKRGWVLRV